jgi:hypothetical protein
MNKVQRKKNPKADTEVLLKSKRRCCLCFGLGHDLKEKKGQIAHLDQDPSNDQPDNLAFLCLEHHDQYDSKTSQSKSIQINEVKAYREKLYQLIENGDIIVNAQAINSSKKNKSKQKSAKALNAWLRDKPHICHYCGYSFSIMPDLEEGKSYYVKQAICPKCGNIDEVCRFYDG